MSDNLNIDDEIVRLNEELKYLCQFVEYVKRCGGLIGQEKFIDDFDPIGKLVLYKCLDRGLLSLDSAENVILPPPEPTPLENPESAVKIEPL